MSRRGVLGAAATACLVFAACDDSSPSMLDPRGPGAERIAGLWWLMLWISAAVFLVVLALMFVALFRRKRSEDGASPDGASPAWGERLIVIGGVIVPTVILASVFIISLRDLNALSAIPDRETLRVEVEGNLWWWEVRYPEAGAVTANEIHIPVGEPVVLELTTEDVIHSVWVPELQAKTDMVPGRTNRMTVEADEAGTYRGQCAEYCGLQHARMAFYVVAQDGPDFDAWLANESNDRREPSSPSERAGEDIFTTSSCAGCHAIRGTSADAEVGPDLTHLAARARLAAGTIPNERGFLSGWIADPQTIKPGAKMPATELSPQELSSVVDYLESLD